MTPFIAQPATLDPEQEYVGGGSMFRPGKQARQLLPPLDGGSLFAYLFRRFGYPNLPWDDQKNLVSYLLTTPLEDVFLTITPYLGQDGVSLMFGCIVKESVEREFSSLLAGGGHVAWTPTHPLRRSHEEAFAATMRDLLRPVYVRDVPINCTGRIDDERGDLPEKGEYSPLAGYAIPREWIASEERYIAFVEALMTLGKGSMEEGVQQVLKIAASDPAP